MKKLLGVFCALAFVIGASVGCGSDVCDKAEKCCTAVSSGISTACKIVMDAYSDSECQNYLDTYKSLASAPAECK